MDFGLRLSLNREAKTSPGAPPYTAVPLGSLVASCVFDLDATVAASYSGSGANIANLEATPADGSAQSVYDATVTGAAFNGSAGSPSAYFSLDGTGDYFTLNTNTTFTKNFHKSTGGQAHTLILLGSIPSTGVASYSQALFGTCSNSGVNHGVAYYSGLWFGNRDKFAISQQTGSVNTSFTTANTADGTNKLIAITFDPSTRGYKLYVNSTTPNTGTGGAYTGTTDPTFPLQIMAAGNGAAPVVSGSRFYAAAGFNAILSDADIATIAAEYNARHSRTYI